MRNDFEAWENGAPLVTINGDPDFDLWENGAPVSDVGEISGSTSSVRRRVCIF